MRTIGVVTKPDNIPPGEHDKWLTLAKNENSRQTLALGYYVVKNPGQKQLNEGITFADARQRESDYFSTDTHWAAVEADLGSRLGTANLRNALSDVLVKRIVQELPVMYRHALEKLKASLSALDFRARPCWTLRLAAHSDLIILHSPSLLS